jgi:hypothetical protein
VAIWSKSNKVHNAANELVMQGSDYIFFLQDKLNRFWGLDSSGNVVLNANPYPLVFSPDGWDDTTIKNIRNKKYWAVDRTVSASFKYVEDAAKILKYIFYTRGVEESVYLAICEQRLVYTPAVEYGYWYKQVFKSEIDFSVYEHNGAYVTVTTAEEGLAKHLKANENTVYEFPLYNPGVEKVKLDGIVLNASANFINPEFPDVGASGPHGSANYVLPISFINKEGGSTGVAFLSSTFENISGSPSSYFPASNNYFFYTVKAITIRIVGSIKADFGSPQSCNFKIQDNYNTVHFNANPGGSLYTGITVIPFDVTVSLPADTKLFFWVADPLGDTIDYLDSDISIKLDTRFEPTYIPFLRPQFLFNELIIKMTNGEYSAEDCEYFNDLHHANKVFTSGNGIRNLIGATLKISFSQFFSFFDTFDAVGIREKSKKVLFDRKFNLTDTATVIDLGEISRPSIKFDKSFPFNELAIGYPDVKNENGMLNGKNEVNTTFNFSLGTTKTPRKYDKVSPVKVSCYDIENIRIETANKDTTDNKSDNEPYAIHITNTLIPGSGIIPAHYELNRDYNAFVSGVDQISSVFNLIFSPKNNFLRSGDFIRSSFYKCDNKTFKFLTADRNKNMAYVNGANIVVESADVPMADLAVPFFTPIIIDAEVNAPEDLNDELDDNPLQIFQFTFEGNTYKGISLENSVNPKRNKKQTFSMLSVPDNDLTPLIDYYG